MPSINQVHREWESRGVSVLLVDIREDRATVARAVAERGYAAPVVLDLDGGVSDAYGIHATPTAFLIARDEERRRRRVDPVGVADGAV